MVCVRLSPDGEGEGDVMSRRHADPVQVRRRDDAPEQFLWRGRLYQVREVLEHWIEAGAWWRSVPGSALYEGTDVVPDPSARPDEPALVPIPASPKWAQRAWGEPAPDVGASAGPMTLDDGERELWRVEARAGRMATPGIYDLSFDWSANRWHLVQVMD
jgi:hypothetical protein